MKWSRSSTSKRPSFKQNTTNNNNRQKQVQKKNTQQPTAKATLWRKKEREIKYMEPNQCTTEKQTHTRTQTFTHSIHSGICRSSICVYCGRFSVHVSLYGVVRLCGWFSWLMDSFNTVQHFAHYTSKSLWRRVNVCVCVHRALYGVKVNKRDNW